MLKNILQKVSW